MLKTKGNQIIDEKGTPTPLRGFCIGTWMMMENFMMGYPGTEQHLRGFLRKYAGEEKANLFFDYFLNDFLQEADIEFMKKIGCTCIRVPFNFRHFEEDKEPFKYKEEGFKHLDRVIDLCKKHGIYVILDMHSVPGNQNPNWHSDNPTAQRRLFQEPIYQERMKELWKYIADHYKDEDAVAGYDLMNEPAAFGSYEMSVFNKINKETTRSIREVDKKHIIFLKGNLWGRSFDGFEPPFEDNLVYSCHFYAHPIGSTLGYPRFEDIEKSEGFTNQVSSANMSCFNIITNRSLLEQQMDARDHFMRKYNVPCWVGEFGLTKNNPLYEEDAKRVLRDQLDIFNERGHSWSFWSYKHFVGPVSLSDDSDWMKFTEEIRALKHKYNCDLDGEAGDKWQIGNMLKPFYYSDFKNSAIDVDTEIRHQLSLIFSKGLSDMFCKKLAGLSIEEMKKLTSSFLYENCMIDADLKKIFETYLM